MTGGRARWTEEGQAEADDTRREKRWAALPHLHAPRRGPPGRRRRPRLPRPGTAATRADEIGPLCLRAARAARAAVHWPPMARPPREGGRRRATGDGSPPQSEAGRQVRGDLQGGDARRESTAHPAEGARRNATQTAPPLGGAEIDASSGRRRPARRRHEPTSEDDGPAQAIANTTPRQQQRGNNSRETDGESEGENKLTAAATPPTAARRRGGGQQ